jgi:SAM domain (Sterile alpha motif)
MDVVVWLRSLAYEALFRENDIDETVLPTLTAQDLKELGVVSFGHRRKLLDAIAALRNDPSGKAPSIHAETTSTVPSALPEDRAIHRQVTAMFSHLVGPTALTVESARSDQTARSGRFPSMTEALHTAEVAIPRKLTLSRSLGLAHGDGSRAGARSQRDFLGHQSHACAFAVVETTRSQQCPV